MPKRIEAATDIATIGNWDPAQARHDLRRAKLAQYQDTPRADAQDGRLLYIVTDGDIAFPTQIFLDESLHAEVLAVASNPTTSSSLSLRPGD